MKFNGFQIIFLLFVLSLSVSTYSVHKRHRKITASALQDKKTLDDSKKKLDSLMDKIQSLNQTINKPSSNLNATKTQIKNENKIVSLQAQIAKVLKNIAAKISDKSIQSSLKSSITAVSKAVNTTAKSTKKIEKQAKLLIKEASKVAKVAKKDKLKAENLTKTKKIKEKEEKKKSNLTVPTPPSAHSFRTSPSTLKKAESAENVGGIISACVAGLVSSLQGPFCYKKGADFGKIPTGCAPGLERRLALCFERCRPGYSHFLGVCWTSCDRGWTNIGALCTQIRKKWIFRYPVFRAKKSYIPSSYTNFNAKATCPTGLYKGGALCYRDCGKINYVNCGIGACSSDRAACVAGILNMVISIGIAVINCVSIVLSMGASTAGTNQAISQAASQSAKLSTTAIRSANNAVKGFLRYMKSQASKFLDVMKNKVKDMFKNKPFEMLRDQLIKNVCEDVMNKALQKAEENTLEKKISRIDITGVFDAVQECKKIGQENTAAQKTACARGVLGVAGAFDPTGLLNVAAAFTYSTCTDV